MLIIDLQVLPGGRTTGAFSLSRAGVANLSELAAWSDYLVVVIGDDGSEHRFLVRQHRRDDGPWELVRRITVELGRVDRPPLPEEYAELAERIAAAL